MENLENTQENTLAQKRLKALDDFLKEFTPNEMLEHNSNKMIRDLELVEIKQENVLSRNEIFFYEMFQNFVKAIR